MERPAVPLARAFRRDALERELDDEVTFHVVPGVLLGSAIALSAG